LDTNHSRASAFDKVKKLNEEEPPYVVLAFVTWSAEFFKSPGKAHIY